VTLQETLEAKPTIMSTNDSSAPPQSPRWLSSLVEQDRYGQAVVRWRSIRRIADLCARKGDGALPRRIQCPIQTFQTHLQPDQFRDELHNSGLAWLLGSLKADVVPLQSGLSRVQIFQLSHKRVAVKPLCL
jgi:hypothetical protein